MHPIQIKIKVQDPIQNKMKSQRIKMLAKK